MKRFLRAALLVFVAAGLVTGCASSKKDILDDGLELPEITEAPPRTEWILPPEVAVPPELVLKFVQWSVDDISADPAGYVAALYSDVVTAFNYGKATRDYIENLKRARERTLEKWKAEHGEDAEPPVE